MDSRNIGLTNFKFEEKINLNLIAKINIKKIEEIVIKNGEKGTREVMFECWEHWKEERMWWPD